MQDFTVGIKGGLVSANTSLQHWFTPLAQPVLLLGLVLAQKGTGVAGDVVSEPRAGSGVPECHRVLGHPWASLIST